MKMKKFLALTATVAMVASMAVGCGNSGNSDKTDGKQRQNLMRQMISQLFQEKMVREQEVLLSSCSELKKKTLQEKK